MIERLDEIVEIAEDEELRAHHHQLQYRQLHHAGDIEEVELEYLPHRVGQVEHVGSPPYRQQHREHAQHRHQCHVYEVVEPRHVDVCAVTYGDDTEQRALARLLGFLLGVDAVAEPSALVHAEHVVYASDGLYATELEHPPYQHLHRQQHVAIPGRCRRESHDEQRYPCIEYVRARYVVVVARYDVPLPQCEHEQYRGEDERHKIVRNEHYTERYDDERHEHNGRIDAETALYLSAREAHKQREEDGTQQPGVLYEQLGRHEEEVVIHERARHHHRHGKDEHGDEQYEAHLLLHEVVGAEAARHEPAHEHVAQQGCHNDVEQNEQAQTHHYRSAPLRIHLSFGAVDGFHLLGVVFLAHIRLSVMVGHRHRGDNLEIVLVAVDKYVVLYLVVALHGIVVHLLEA